MAYIKYKELTKYFDFSKYVMNKDLPKYTLDYVYEDEDVLVAYKTFRDYGLFTTKKILLFDNSLSMRPFKEVYSVPYASVSSSGILFRKSQIILKFDLDSGYQLRLHFINMSREDKVRLRLLYSVISRIISNQKLDKKVTNELINDIINFKED